MYLYVLFVPRRNASDLCVSTQRPLWACGRHKWKNYGGLGERSRLGTAYSVCCVWVSVQIVEVMKRSRQGGRSTRIIGHVMEGVHEEFRLARRENKWGGGAGRSTWGTSVLYRSWTQGGVWSGCEWRPWVWRCNVLRSRSDRDLRPWAANKDKMSSRNF